MMEMMLKMQNPQAYNQYMNYKNSGKTPQQVINELIEAGQINQDMLNKARNMAANGGDMPSNNGNIDPRYKF